MSKAFYVNLLIILFFIIFADYVDSPLYIAAPNLLAGVMFLFRWEKKV